MKKWHIVVAAAIVAIAPSALKTHAAAKLKIGFVYLGPIGDLGWKDRPRNRTYAARARHGSA